MHSLGTPDRRAAPSGWVLVAAVIMLVFGVLGVITGLVAVVIAMLADTLVELFDSVGTAGAVGGMLTVLAVISILAGILGVLLIVCGIGVLRRARWARTGGIVIAGLDLVLTVVGNAWTLIPGAVVDPLTGGPLPMTTGDMLIGSLVPLVTVVGHVVVIVVLVRSRTEFEG